MKDPKIENGVNSLILVIKELNQQISDLEKQGVKVIIAKDGPVHSPFRVQSVTTITSYLDD